MDRRERDKRWQNGDGYDRYIRAELTSFRKDAWKRQLGGHFAPGAALDILDVGTGPGFFACILSEEGHRVTGIDASEGMLSCARKNADALNVHPRFMKMDLNEMSFPDESFDAIVLRNVSWTLQYPERVYTELKRLLRPGGILLIYDANWHMHWFDEELKAKVLAREQRYFETYGRREIVSGGDMEYYKTAPLTHTLRPAWDKETLSHLGFEVTVTEDVGRFVYEEWEKELYAESPLFEICAIKREMDPTQDNMHTYWQDKAAIWDKEPDLEELRRIAERIERYLPEGKQRILDVGTGPGALACAMALQGHTVTAVDLTSNMIRRAESNAERLGADVTFLVTAADELPFADDSFDAVICRNLTWALPHPEETLRQWQRVLRAGGRLIYQDANHYYYMYNDEDRANRELYAKVSGSYRGPSVRNYDTSLCDDTARDLPLSRLDRPGQWDDAVLPKLGFEILAEEIYRPQKLLKYGLCEKTQGYYTWFLIAAINGKEPTERS